jgi:hypothetical protein
VREIGVATAQGPGNDCDVGPMFTQVKVKVKAKRDEQITDLVPRFS